MDKIFSFSFSIKAAKLLLQYPSTIPLFFGKFSKLSDHLTVLILNGKKIPAAPKYTNGFSIFLNPDDTRGISAYIAATGIWELGTTEVFRKFLKKGMTVVDVGANIGWYTLLSAILVGKDGLVLAFEPESTNYSLLAKSVKENQFKQVKIFNQCLSDTTGPKTLYLSDYSGMHSIARPTKNKMTVMSSELDKTVQELDIRTIDLIKIDVEGAEPEVLWGARGLLEESRIKRIILEWNPEVWSKRGDFLAKILQNFDVYMISSFSPFILQKIDSGRILKMPSLTNLFLSLKNKDR